MSQPPPPPELRAPLVGRELELAALRRAAESALDQREVHTVTLVGGPGIGKARIVEEFLAQFLSERPGAFRVLQARVRPPALSHGLIERLLRARFGIQDGEVRESSVERIRTEVASVLDDRRVGDVCFLLGSLMGILFPETPLTRVLAEDAAQARVLRRSVVRSFFETDAVRKPLCVVLEDLHASDGDSLELIGHLLEHGRGPVLLICLTRAELLSRYEGFRELGGARHEVLELGPVSAESATRILRELLSHCEGGAPQQLLDAALGMSGGTPGLMEAMVRVFFEAGVLVEAKPELIGQRRWLVDLDRLQSARLPLTVDDAVLARLSALSVHERRVLEHAAAVGSVFWLGALIALGRLDAKAPDYWTDSPAEDVAKIRRLLSSLVERDYLLRLPDSAFTEDEEYIFKHNREREKIAELTSPAALRRYHQTIADFLSQKEAVRSQEEYLAVLARHLEHAGSLTRAAFIYLEAGTVAREHFAAKKAHEYYQKGLTLLGSDDARRRIDALHDMGDVLLLLGRTDEALATFREMLELSFRLGLHGKGGAAHNRMGRVHRDTGSLSLAQEHLETSLTLFERARDTRGIASCHDDIGKLLWMRGEYQLALEELRRGLDMRKALGDGRSIALSLNNIGLVWRDHGQEAQAREALEAALKIRRELSDPMGIVESLNDLGQLALDQGEHPQALELLEEAHVLAQDLGEHNRIAVVLANIGEAHLRTHDTLKAIEVLLRAEQLCEDLGDKLHLADVKRALSKTYLERGDLKAARECIKRSVDLFGQVRSKPHLAVALRTLGEVTGAGAWGDGHEVKAVDYFMRSIAICKEIGNEIEVAKSYRAFSGYVSASAHYQNIPEIQREAQKLSAMADEIFERHRIVISSTSASTNPIS
ncbi:MAG TPA: tetratricopeptide repeat protein [Polyangiaceae bacterium]|nr:tetratricopeptide repeat protein [Polyangiaceae bacterium]